jgi:hypothetical protein
MIENKYSKTYWKIIENARLRSSIFQNCIGETVSDGANLWTNFGPNFHLVEYYEKHHAHPKALEGSDDESNIVLLSPKEHYICHHLLTKFTEGEDRRKMLFAWHLMCHFSIDDRRYIPAVQYDYLRRELAKAGKSEEHKAKMSESAKKRKPRVFSEQAKKNMSEARRRDWAEGKYSSVPYKGIPKSEEHKAKIAAAHLGLKTSEETKRKISEGNKGKKRKPMSQETKLNMVEAQRLRWEKVKLLKNTDLKGT